MSDREEIKAKLDIVEVIREYIPVKSTGANFQALCPFHNEKSPSFSISPDKQIWHCFGCGRGGDVFSFIMEKEGLTFIEALRLLATKAGVTLNNDNPESRSKRNRLLDIMELAGKYYAHVLKSEAGKKAKEYLLARGLKEATIEDWGLGYSPDSWSSLYEFLLARPKVGSKYSDEEIAAAGLIIKREGSLNSGRQYYDRFRDRIMFPIADVNNNLVAFTARVNPEKEKTEKMGKYINSPQTEIYDKSRILFGLNRAKDAIKKADLVILVEGQMDVIACYNHNVKNVIATSGTALTTEQVTLIKRFTKNIALAFDMDEAGQNAADRGIKEALAQGLNIKVITLPYGKDPDECLKRDPDAFRQAVENAQPMLAYYFQKASAGLDLNSLENKRQVRDKMFTMIALVPDKSEQGYWLKRIGEELDLSEGDLREDFNKFQNSNTLKQYRMKAESGYIKASFGDVKLTINKERALATESNPATREDLMSELFLALIIRLPELIGCGLERLDPAQTRPEENSRFYKNLIIYYNKANSLDYNHFRAYLESEAPEFVPKLEKLVLVGEKEFYGHTYEQARDEVIKIAIELRRADYQRRIHQLEKALMTTEKAAGGQGDPLEVERIMLELKQVTEELNKLI